MVENTTKYQLPTTYSSLFYRNLFIFYIIFMYLAFFLNINIQFSLIYTFSVINDIFVLFQALYGHLGLSEEVSQKQRLLPWSPRQNSTKERTPPFLPGKSGKDLFPKVNILASYLLFCLCMSDYCLLSALQRK